MASPSVASTPISTTAGSTAAPSADDKALFVLRVPDDAVVYFAGQKMTNDGSRRTFVSPELKAGKVYSYDIKVEMDGEEVAGRQKIRRGDRVELEVEMADEKLTLKQAAGQDLLELKLASADADEADDAEDEDDADGPSLETDDADDDAPTV